MNLKKIFIIAAMMLVILAVAAVSGCNEGSDDGPKATEKSADATDVPEVTEEPTAAPTEVPWQVDDQGRRLAGTDSGLTRDGTPKKYFTISFDDGITQDEHIIEIYMKYNFTSGTFFIDTGLFGVSWDWVGQTLGMPSLKHVRWTEAQIRAGIYDGYDVAVHTRGHMSLKDQKESVVIQQVQEDADNIYGITGIYPVGMAWPGGDTEYNDTTIKIVRDKTTIKFARATTTTNKFKLPKYWLKWTPTCSITAGNLLKLAEKFVAAEAEEDMLFYVWGHGYELDFYDSWDVLDQLIKMMTEADDIICVTNSEFYQLFKDEVPAYK